MQVCSHFRSGFVSVLHLVQPSQLPAVRSPINYKAEMANLNNPSHQQHLFSDQYHPHCVWNSRLHEHLGVQKIIQCMIMVAAKHNPGISFPRQSSHARIPTMAWPSNFPPFRVNEDVSKHRAFPRIVRPFQVRIVRTILETFRQGDRNVRWYVMHGR
jgi:hypothetical protein